MKKIPSITCVFGGQWGSESKGQILAAIVRDDNPDLAFAVRVGGPNAGHTARFPDGDFYAVQSLPIPAFTEPGVIIPVIGAGGIIRLSVLEKELVLLREMCEICDVAPTPVYIDSSAMVVTDQHIQDEHRKDQATNRDLCDKIGSTREGVGAALAAKIRRQKDETISQYLLDVHEMGLRTGMPVQVVQTVDMLNNSRYPIYLEGTQGHLLSIHTSGFYPFTTSRECGPDAILADAGLSSRAAEELRIVCVFRTFPIRVGGNSGEMRHEVDWEEMKLATDGYVSTPETTTVTGRQRRIAEWDSIRAVRTVRETRPTEVAIAFLDYLDPSVAGSKSHEQLSSAIALKAKNHNTAGWLRHREAQFGVPITYVSTMPGQEHTFRVKVNEL